MEKPTMDGELVTIPAQKISVREAYDFMRVLGEVIRPTAEVQRKRTAEDTWNEDPLYHDGIESNKKWLHENGLNERYERKNTIEEHGYNPYISQTAFRIKMFRKDPDITDVVKKIEFLVPLMKFHEGKKWFDIFEQGLKQYESYRLTLDESGTWRIEGRYRRMYIETKQLRKAVQYILENVWYE